MTPQDEPGVLALLLGIAAVLYVLSWLVAGSPRSPWDASPESATPYISQEPLGQATVALAAAEPS